MTEHKNTILAIVLSLVVVVGWQFFVGYPQMEKQRQEALLKQQEQAHPQPGASQPGCAPATPAPKPARSPRRPCRADRLPLVRRHRARPRGKGWSLHRHA